LIRGQRLSFGIFLAERRQRAGTTQRKLAKKSGLSPAYVAALESGTSEPPPPGSRKVLARSLDVEREEMWRLCFAARLTKSLMPKAIDPGIPETDLLEIVEGIKAAT